MTGLSLALANLKPGTGKTTSAVWLAHIFARAGNSVLLVDADPSGSALEWSDLAAMDPRFAPRQAFPFRIVAPGYAPAGAALVAASVPGSADPAEPGSGPAWPAYTTPSARTAAHA